MRTTMLVSAAAAAVVALTLYDATPADAAPSSPFIAGAPSAAGRAASVGAAGASATWQPSSLGAFPIEALPMPLACKSKALRTLSA